MITAVISKNNDGKNKNKICDDTEPTTLWKATITRMGKRVTTTVATQEQHHKTVTVKNNKICEPTTFWKAKNNNNWKRATTTKALATQEQQKQQK